MGPITDDISEYMGWYTWAMLSGTDRAQKNLTLDKEFTSQDAMQSVMHSAGFEWAPGLLECLQSDTPPTIDWFKTLPMHYSTWGVYVLVLEKDGESPRLYTSSGTSADIGVRKRMDVYDLRMELLRLQLVDNSIEDKPNSKIPRFVEDSLAEGFIITSKGLLGWTPIPRPSEVWSLRCFVLVLEATFSMAFWTMKSRKDYRMPHLSPWLLEAFTYEGLCSHFSINESIAGTPTSGTPEEINELAEERRVSKQALYIANKGPGVHAANTKQYGDSALEEQRYRCNVCDLIFRSNAKLQEHLGRQSIRTKPLEYQPVKHQVVVLSMPSPRRSIGARSASMLLLQPPGSSPT